MRSVTVRLDDLRTMILNLGFVGENEHRKFNFDCKKMFGEYPSASVSLTVQPPAGECYPATVERDGDLVSWTVMDSDLIEEGYGEIQLTFMVGDVVAKTCIGRTKVERSLGATGDIPTPIENWIEQAEEVISEAEAATAAAEDAAAHQPIIDDNGYWAVWDADAEEYVATEYKAQGTDGHDGVGIVSIEKTGTSGLVDTYTITFTSGNPVTYTVTNGRDADPAELIDDTAGEGDTDKVWSADKSSSLLTEINTKQDAPETAGTSGQVLGLDGNLKPEWKTVSGGGVVDSSMSTSSTNPVQNKVITEAYNTLEEFVRKETTAKTEGTLTVTSGSPVFSSTHLVDVNIANGESYTFKLEADSKISKFHLYANGSAIKYNCSAETVYSLTAGTDITYLSIYCDSGDVVGSGTIKGVVVSKVPTQNSLEKRIDDLETDVGEIEEDVADLGDDVNKLNSVLELDYSMADRHDPDDDEIDKYVNPSTGAISSTTGYFTTDYMEILPSETLYFYRRDTLEALQCGFYAGYDKNKNFVSNSGGSNVSSVTQSGNVKYIRVSFQYQSAYYNRRPEGVFVVATSKPKYAPGMITDPVLTQKYMNRKDVYIYGSDTESQIIEKLVNAYNTGNCDVHFERAHYTFGTALASVKTTYKLLTNEIPVGNNCRYFFNGATLEATIDLQTLGSDFYCNLFGCQRSPSSFEMYDGILKATDTRYVVHDEASGYTATYRHVYRNMVMQYVTDDSTDIYRKCIGGGTGKNGVVDIDGCKFITDGQEPDVSYHGNSNDVAGAEFNINIRNSWFSKTFAANELSANQTARLFFCGNSTSAAIVSYARWDVTSFLNEVRT